MTMAFGSKCAIVVVTLFALALTHGGGVVDARRNQGSNQRKTSSSSSSSGHVTQSPSYNNQGSNGNSHADVAKLSYPNYNSQPNRAANNPPAAGWNVPQGPPPAYSHQPAAGHTNIHEPPPSYHSPNYGGPPSNVHQPIAANNYGQQYAGAPPQYGGHVPMGQPAGVPYGGYHSGGAAAPPPGATYYQPGSALPPGAVFSPQAPQQSSSGLGLGTGLLVGGLGGAALGHLLTSNGGSSSQPAAAAPASAGGQDRIIIINNGVPMNATDGTTVINGAGVAAAPMNTTQTSSDAPPAQLAPFSPLNATMPMANGTDAAAAAAAAPPPPGGIICVPTKVNETDPADSSKMIEVEKIACYPAPPPAAAAPGAEPVPLAPMAPMAPTSQSPPAMLAPDQAAIRSNASNAGHALHIQSAFPLLAALLSGLLLRLTAGN